MDNFMKDTADLLDYIDKVLDELMDDVRHEHLVTWADLDDRFRHIKRNIRTQTLKIDEAIRWD